MTTTLPTEFTGTPTLTPEKVASLKDWYTSALERVADAEENEGDPEEIHNDGLWAEAMEHVLRLLYDVLPAQAITTEQDH